MKTRLPHLFRALVLLLLVGGAIFPPLSAAEPGEEKIPLWEKAKAPDGDGGFADENASLFIHRPAKPNGTAVIICPGGGYGTLVMDGEGRGIAEWLGKHGITGIVLQYRLPEGRAHVPLLDAQRAIRLVRSKAKDWDCDPARIGILGFSAGGHLASTAATRSDKGDSNASDPVSRESSRPDFCLLVYPVITMGEITHGGSRDRLLGPDPSPEMIREYSSELQVTKDTPPTFLAHAKNDSMVPIAHSRMFHEALERNSVSSELLELPSGNHGLDGYKGPMWEAWQTASLKWLAELGFLKNGEGD